MNKDEYSIFRQVFNNYRKNHPKMEEHLLGSLSPDDRILFGTVLATRISVTNQNVVRKVVKIVGKKSHK